MRNARLTDRGDRHGHSACRLITSGAKVKPDISIVEAPGNRRITASPIDPMTLMIAVVDAKKALGT